MARLALTAVLVMAMSAHAAEPEKSSGESRAVEMVVVGTFGLLAAGGYTLGAYLTGDQPSGYTLAILGAVGAGGMLGSWLGLAINASQHPKGITVGVVLLPLLSGLAGAVIGGVTAGFTARDPGASRTATHGFVIGVLITDTLLAELTEALR